MSIRRSKRANHLPEGVSPAPGTSHGFIICAFANGVSLELPLLVDETPSARSHGFGGGGVDMFFAECVCMSRFVFSKTPRGDSRRDPPPEWNECEFLLSVTRARARVYTHTPRVLLSDTYLERKKLFVSSVDGETPSRLRERERESVYREDFCA